VLLLFGVGFLSFPLKQLGAIACERGLGCNSDNKRLHSGVISSSFDFMQILMTICEIGLFIGSTISVVRGLCQEYFCSYRQAGVLRDNDMFALGTAFGLASLSHQPGFLAASGEFLAGVIIAGSNFSEQISVIMFV
jgi:monovalent cation:H+ antiporter-2, CPA2 family